MWLHPDYGKLARAYDELYKAGKVKGRAAMRTATTYDSPRLVALAERCRALAPNAYAEAMWERRAYLHTQGRDGEVYDGTDALRWKEAMRRQGAA
jgi:hypothetical protein